MKNSYNIYKYIYMFMRLYIILTGKREIYLEGNIVSFFWSWILDVIFKFYIMRLFWFYIIKNKGIFYSFEVDR